MVNRSSNWRHCVIYAWRRSPVMVLPMNLLTKVVFGFVCPDVFISSILSSNTRPIALFCYLCSDDSTPEQKEEFLREIEQMKLLGAHQNIVSLVGCCTLQEQLLVTEYVPYGDLLQWLRRGIRSVGNLELSDLFSLLTTNSFHLNFIFRRRWSKPSQCSC